LTRRATLVLRVLKAAAAVVCLSVFREGNVVTNHRFAGLVAAATIVGCLHALPAGSALARPATDAPENSVIVSGPIDKEEGPSNNPRRVLVSAYPKSSRWSYKVVPYSDGDLSQKLADAGNNRWELVLTLSNPSRLVFKAAARE
jgi:hypothetical protein